MASRLKRRRNCAVSPSHTNSWCTGQKNFFFFRNLTNTSSAPGILVRWLTGPNSLADTLYLTFDCSVNQVQNTLGIEGSLCCSRQNSHLSYLIIHCACRVRSLLSCCGPECRAVPHPNENQLHENKTTRLQKTSDGFTSTFFFPGCFWRRL